MTNKLLFIFILMIITYSCKNAANVRNYRIEKNGFTKEDLKQTLMNNEQIGVTGYGLRPDIFIPITNENSIYSKEFLFRDGGGLWFYAHLAKDGEIILEMGDDKLYKLGYDYYGNKINK